MSDQLLQLKIGDAIQVQLASDQNDTRHMVRVIGAQPGVSLLIATPRVHGSTLLLREGQLMTIRLLTGNAVYGFETRVLRVCTSPFPYLHVAYPKEFASTVVRKAQRASTHVIASVENADRGGAGEEPFSVVIGDLSVAGASLLAPAAIGAVGDSLMIRTRLTVGGIEKYLSLSAVIRGVRVRDEPGAEAVRYRHGVEFQMLGPDDQLVLHGYVYEQIALGKAI
jgi:c-di-GMP-binding flagellar brake protein YcgR